ncbi:polysaccharide deacetylase family protein [Actinomadura viridis]|uniref:Peptidoglycan/xylan/chitin deacetylase (PgdA/CDA1 family) n=1 Tax=Actinomadura viridis TaxID=58110 RepID=A0A931DA62_9ACTN|nr:polysaccharide deacetylase family protein [Actinomadura viridis]MBG6087314.1 peptidoglycan/xylan/chitin deacetylase (PgdA/CDA1 family) [Actinomadura viridis]
MRSGNLAILVVLGLTLATACSGQGTKQRQAENARHQAALKKGAAPRQPRIPPPRRLDCARLKCVALTFDDGPGDHTARVLDSLRGVGARATFFMLGQNVASYPDVVRRMAFEGHELANHTWSHPVLTELSPAAVRAQVARTQQAIKEASGVTPTMFRPPYGATDARVGRAVGMPQILWSLDSMDWRYRSAKRNADIGVRKTKPGGVVLFHDIHKTTASAVPRILAGLKERGFTFVTVTELFQSRRLAPGSRYTELRETP